MKEKYYSSVTESVYNWFTSWRFPVLLLSIVIFFTLFLFGLFLIPVSDGPLGQFAQDFRTWCFGVDPDTGKTRYIYGIMMVLDPVFLAAIVYMFWKKPLDTVFKERPISLYRIISYGLIPVFIGALVFFFLGRADQELRATQLEFPAERMRTELKLPEIILIDQDQNLIDVRDYKDKVVMMTSFYATCGHTCPRIMQQVRKSVEKVDSALHKDLVVLAITMDPKQDSPKNLNTFARLQKMSMPLYHFLTGDEVTVNRVLDSLSVSRKVNQADGSIDHANLIFLVDRKGTIAYRFGLGEIQEQWLSEAIVHLIKEQ